MAPAQSLYEKVVVVSTEYLGPAAERFIRRQIDTHLGIKPEALSVTDLPELFSWIRLTFALLTENQDVIEAFMQDLEKLAKKQHLKAGNR